METWITHWTMAQMVGGRSFKSLASAATPIQPLRYHPELVQYFYWTLYLDLLLLQLQSHPGGHMLRPLSAAATTTSLYAAKVAAIGSRSSTFMGDCIDPLPCWSGPLVHRVACGRRATVEYQTVSYIRYMYFHLHARRYCEPVWRNKLRAGEAQRYRLQVLPHRASSS